MKKILSILFLTAAIAATSVVCVRAYATESKRITSISSAMTTRQLNLADFNEIETERINVVYTIGTPGTATLTAPDNIIDLLEVKVRDHKLIARVNLRENNRLNGINNARLNATLTVSSSAVKEVEAYLSAKVTVKSDINITSDFDAETSTSGSIEFKSVKCNSFDAECSTSGSIVLPSLTCNKTDLETSTSGLIDIKTLICSKSELEASTSSNIKINNITADYAEATASTSGNITVKGGKVINSELEASTSGQVTYKALTVNGSAEANTSGSISAAGLNSFRSLTKETGGRLTEI